MSQNGLYEIVAPMYGVTNRDSSAQKEAYDCLKKLRTVLDATPPCFNFPKKYLYMRYLYRFFDAREAFMQEDYVQACWELTDLLDSEPDTIGLRPGVKVNLCVLLDEYLKE